MRNWSWRTAVFGVFLGLSSIAMAASVPADIMRQLPPSDEVISTATLSVGRTRTFYLVAMASKDESKLPSKPWLNRSLWIFERQPANRFKFAARNDDVILRPFHGGIYGCDPFEARTITVKGAYFTVENGIACSAHWTDFVTFRFDGKSNGFVFDNWRTESWSMNRNNDPHAEALVSDGQKVVRAKGRSVPFDKWKRPDSPTARHCAVIDVEACSAMWELSTRKDFIAAMRKFLGPGKASWTMENWDRADQVLTTLSVSSEDPTPVGDGFVRMGGCFPHNCPERAEVFFGRAGEIKAVTLLYHDCAGRTCTGDEDYTLRILVRDNSPTLIGHAKNWANEEMRSDNEKFPHFGLQRVSRTVVDVLTK